MRDMSTAPGTCGAFIFYNLPEAPSLVFPRETRSDTTEVVFQYIGKKWKLGVSIARLT
jgi:hypothetical protein